MKNKTVLITGGAGFIGSNLVLALQEHFPENEYIVLDNFFSGSEENLREFKGKVIKGDVAEKSSFRLLPSKVGVIFHQAAMTDTTVQDREKMFQANVRGFQNALGFAKESQAKLIYASSAAVYGAGPVPMRVGEGEEPLNPYGASKLEVDHIVTEEIALNPERVIIGMRYFNVYGPREAYKGKMASMVWQLYLQMKAGKRPRVFEFGEQRRDFVYVKDVALANILALHAQKSGIVNIGTGKSSSFNEIIRALNKAMGINLEPEYFKNPYTTAYQENTEADLTEARELLGYEPQYDLESGVHDYLETVNIRSTKSETSTNNQNANDQNRL